jgi:hypothetical protein
MACRRATRRTLPPSASTSASSAAFSCAPQIRRRALGPRISTSAKNASFWSPEGGSIDQQHRRVPAAPLHGPGRALTDFRPTFRRRRAKRSSSLMSTRATPARQLRKPPPQKGFPSKWSNCRKPNAALSYCRGAGSLKGLSPGLRVAAGLSKITNDTQRPSQDCTSSLSSATCLRTQQPW